MWPPSYKSTRPSGYSTTTHVPCPTARNEHDKFVSPFRIRNPAGESQKAPANHTKSSTSCHRDGTRHRSLEAIKPITV